MNETLTKERLQGFEYATVIEKPTELTEVERVQQAENAQAAQEAQTTYTQSGPDAALSEMASWATSFSGETDSTITGPEYSQAYAVTDESPTTSMSEGPVEVEIVEAAPVETVVAEVEQTEIIEGDTVTMMETAEEVVMTETVPDEVLVGEPPTGIAGVEMADNGESGTTVFTHSESGVLFDNGSMTTIKETTTTGNLGMDYGETTAHGADMVGSVFGLTNDDPRSTARETLDATMTQQVVVESSPSTMVETDQVNRVKAEEPSLADTAHLEVASAPEPSPVASLEAEESATELEANLGPNELAVNWVDLDAAQAALEAAGISYSVKLIENTDSEALPDNVSTMEFPKTAVLAIMSEDASFGDDISSVQAAREVLSSEGLISSGSVI